MWTEHGTIAPEYVQPWTTAGDPPPPEPEHEQSDMPMDLISHSFELMGREVQDRYNGYQGSVTAVTVEIGGMVLCKVESHGMQGQPVIQWCDTTRLDTIGSDHFGFRSTKHEQASSISDGPIHKG